MRPSENLAPTIESTPEGISEEQLNEAWSILVESHRKDNPDRYQFDALVNELMVEDIRRADAVRIIQELIERGRIQSVYVTGPGDTMVERYELNIEELSYEADPIDTEVFEVALTLIRGRKEISWSNMREGLSIEDPVELWDVATWLSKMGVLEALDNRGERWKVLISSEEDARKALIRHKYYKQKGLREETGEPLVLDESEEHNKRFETKQQTEGTILAKIESLGLSDLLEEPEFEAFHSLDVFRQNRVLEILTHLTLARLQNEAEDEYGPKFEAVRANLKPNLQRIFSDTHNALKGITLWVGGTFFGKKFFKAIHEKDNFDAMFRDVDHHRALLPHIIASVDSVSFDEEGNQEYISPSEGPARNEEYEHLAEKFNEAARKFAQMPEHWCSLDNMTATEKEMRTCNKAREEYKKYRAELMEFKLGPGEESPGLREEIELEMNEVDRQIHMDQFFTTHPEIEKLMLDIQNPKVFWRVCKNTFKNSLGFVVTGGVVRTLASTSMAAIGVAGGTIIAPFLAGGVGGYLRGSTQEREDIVDEKDRKLRGMAEWNMDPGSEWVASQRELFSNLQSQWEVVVASLPGEQQTEEHKQEWLASQIQSIKQGWTDEQREEWEEWEKRKAEYDRGWSAEKGNDVPVQKLTINLTRLLNELGSGTLWRIDENGDGEQYLINTGEELEEAQYERRLNSLQARIDYTKGKIDRLKLIRGKAVEHVADELDLVQLISKAETVCKLYKKWIDEEESNKLEERLNRVLDQREEAIDEHERKRIIKRAVKGAVIGGTFALAGSKIAGWILDKTGLGEKLEVFGNSLMAGLFSGEDAPGKITLAEDVLKQGIDSSHLEVDTPSEVTPDPQDTLTTPSEEVLSPTDSTEVIEPIQPEVSVEAFKLVDVGSKGFSGAALEIQKQLTAQGIDDLKDLTPKELFDLLGKTEVGGVSVMELDYVSSEGVQLKYVPGEDGALGSFEVVNPDNVTLGTAQDLYDAAHAAGLSNEDFFRGPTGDYFEGKVTPISETEILGRSADLEKISNAELGKDVTPTWQELTQDLRDIGEIEVIEEEVPTNVPEVPVREGRLALPENLFAYEAGNIEYIQQKIFNENILAGTNADALKEFIDDSGYFYEGKDIQVRNRLRDIRNILQNLQIPENMSPEAYQRAFLEAFKGKPEHLEVFHAAIQHAFLTDPAYQPDTPTMKDFGQGIQAYSELIVMGLEQNGINGHDIPQLSEVKTPQVRVSPDVTETQTDLPTEPAKVKAAPLEEAVAPEPVNRNYAEMLDIDMNNISRNVKISQWSEDLVLDLLADLEHGNFGTGPEVGENYAAVVGAYMQSFERQYLGAWEVAWKQGQVINEDDFKLLYKNAGVLLEKITAIHNDYPLASFEKYQDGLRSRMAEFYEKSQIGFQKHLESVLEDQRRARLTPGGYKRIFS